MRTISLETTEVLQSFILQELPRWIEENPALRRRLREALLESPAQTEEKVARLSPMTYEEFLDWVDEDTLAEWVASPGEEAGEVVMYSPASDRHQDIADFLVSVLRPFVEERQLGLVRSAPFQMKLEHSGREPDVLFVTKDHLDRLQETYLDGPADLAVEIISPESAGRDRGEKFYEYEAGGVAEYWLIDPQKERAEFYQLEADQYQQVAPDTEGIYRSAALPGFWLRVEWLWQKPLPPVEDVMLDVGGEEYAKWLLERIRRRGFLPSSE
jgi:Uma2 family endonuclease